MLFVYWVPPPPLSDLRSRHTGVGLIVLLHGSKEFSSSEYMSTLSFRISSHFTLTNAAMEIIILISVQTWARPGFRPHTLHSLGLTVF